jgi:hypothetical protein
MKVKVLAVVSFPASRKRRIWCVTVVTKPSSRRGTDRILFFSSLSAIYAANARAIAELAFAFLAGGEDRGYETRSAFNSVKRRSNSFRMYLLMTLPWYLWTKGLSGFNKIRGSQNECHLVMVFIELGSKCSECW